MTRFNGNEIKYMESTTSPSGFSQRTVDTPWINTPMDDVLIARESMLVERERVLAEKEARGREAQNTPGFDRFGSLITRSEQNKEIAAKLGIDADQLAERLALPDQNQGTLMRLTEAQFDKEMKKLGLSPEEARARFKGTFWD